MYIYIYCVCLYIYIHTYYIILLTCDFESPPFEDHVRNWKKYFYPSFGMFPVG